MYTLPHIYLINNSQICGVSQKNSTKTKPRKFFPLLDFGHANKNQANEAQKEERKVVIAPIFRIVIAENRIAIDSERR